MTQQNIKGYYRVAKSLIKCDLSSMKDSKAANDALQTMLFLAASTPNKPELKELIASGCTND
ncbi:hypothetical protein [Paenibacillus apiarius]|uniref:hypothetical protein n=1 Tax=Paenibacillus apiarius TaxID=46240 RepID=UPI00197ED6F5|nr:hypothetical protein [Paenibacillus apiarius]MBN3527235.1 hypothetical protein [Paenibacillus apiarius]